MRVCQVIDRLSGGGQERVAVDLARGLVGSVDLSGVLATRAGGDYEPVLGELPVALFVAKRRRRRDPIAWTRMYRWLRLQRFEILHTHSPGSLAAAVHLRRLPGLSYRIVAHLQMLPPHGTPFRDFAERVYRSAASAVDGAFVTNDHLRSFLVDECEYAPTAVRIVMNPVDLSRWHVEGERDVSRSRCRVVMVAQWREQKDHPTAIRAARLVEDRGADAEWMFVGDEDHELTTEARALIRTLDVGGIVRIMGRRTDIPEILAESDIGLLATHFEGLPVTVLEYGASGLPSIVTRVEGTEMLIGRKHGVVGVPPVDPDALADAVVELVDDPATRRRLGDAARAFVHNRADLGVVTAEVLAAYRDLGTGRALEPG